MIKKILFLILVVFTFSFGEVNDSGNYLKADEKQEIEAKILEIEKNSDIVYHVNLGRKMNEKDIVEKTVILDIIPDGKSEVNVQLKFTQDIDTSSQADEIDNLLAESEEAVTKKEYKTLILNVLDLSDKIVQEIKKEKVEVEKQEVKKSIIENKFAGLVILILIAIAIFTTLKFVKMKGIKRK